VGSLEYEYHQILLVDSDPISISVSDDWSQLSKGELELAFKVKMGTLLILATVATVPTLVQVSHRLRALIHEKSLQADATILNAGLPPRPDSSNRTDQAVSAIASKLGGDSITSSIKILNRLDILADGISIALFPDHFNEGELYRVDAGNGIKAELVRGFGADELVHRNLHLFLGSFSIRKVIHRKISIEEEKSFKIAQWHHLMRPSTERNIFRVPTTAITMESDQDGDKIINSFSMSSDGEFDIALNVSAFFVKISSDSY
jgi:hypothetical protein